MLPMEPVLLYPMLRSMGMRWDRRTGEGGVVELLISEPGSGSGPADGA